MSDPPDDGDGVTADDVAPDAKEPAPPEAEDRSALDEDELRLLDPDEIRASRRPRAIFYVWGWELLCALLVATPVHAWALHAWGRNPDGDAPLFRPGGHALLSWLGDTSPTLSTVARTSAVALFVFIVLGQLVTGALVASLATGMGKAGSAPPAALALRAGARAFVPLSAIGVVFGALEGSLLGLGFFLSAAADHALVDHLGDARSFTARIVVFALFVVLTLAVGIIGDFARVLVVRDVALDAKSFPLARRMRDAIVGALRTARSSLLNASFGWGWRTALALGLVVAGGVAGDIVGARGGTALWILFFVHQLIVGARAALRASWLADALRYTLRGSDL